LTGTKLAGNASRNAKVDYEQLAREILEEAQAVDAAEDELCGDVLQRVRCAGPSLGLGSTPCGVQSDC